jgi:hypothetical protein
MNSPIVCRICKQPTIEILGETRYRVQAKCTNCGMPRTWRKPCSPEVLSPESKRHGILVAG